MGLLCILPLYVWPHSDSSVGAYSPSPKAQRKILQDIHIIIVHCTKVTIYPTLHIFPKVASEACIVSDLEVRDCRSCVISSRVHLVIYDYMKSDYTRTAIGCPAVT